MSPGLGGGGFPRIKEILSYLKSVNDTIFITGAVKSGRVNMRDALGNELGTAAGIPLKVDVSGDFPDNIQGAVEQANADIDPITPGHRIKPVKTGGHANAAAPVAVAENQIADAWYDLNGRLHVSMDDGSLVTLGANADAMVAAGAIGTMSAKLRRVSLDLGEMMIDVSDLAALGSIGGAGIKQDIVRIAGTVPSTPGKLDVKSADGDGVTLGAIADAAVLAGATGTISAKARRLSADLDALLTKVTDLNTLGVAGGVGIKQDIVRIAGTAPTTAGKLDMKIADGDDAAVGAIADAAVLAGATGSVSAKLRRLTTDTDAILTKVTDIDTVVGAAAAALPSKAVAIGLDNAGNTVVAKADAAGNMKVAPKTPPSAVGGSSTGAVSIVASPAFDFWFHSLTMHFSAAPITAGNLTVTINPVEGATFSTVLYKVDPSVGSLTDILYRTDSPLLCKNGDTISVAYANADGATIGARIIVSPA